MKKLKNFCIDSIAVPIIVTLVYCINLLFRGIFAIKNLIAPEEENNYEREEK